MSDSAPANLNWKIKNLKNAFTNNIQFDLTSYLHRFRNIAFGNHSRN
jgi:hypothetical protein